MEKNNLVLVFLLVFPVLGISQTPIWEIVLKNDQPYTNVVLNNLEENTLYVNAFGNTYPIEVDSIKYMKLARRTRSHAVHGFLLGMIGGGIAGNMISRNSANEEGLFSDFNNDISMLLGTGVGMALGGFFGAAMGTGLSGEEYYNFEKRSHPEKIKLLVKLIDQPPKTQH